LTGSVNPESMAVGAQKGLTADSGANRPKVRGIGHAAALNSREFRLSALRLGKGQYS